MPSQLFYVGDEMRGGVTLQVSFKDTGMWNAARTIALIEEHEAVGAGIEEPAVPGDTSRTGATVQDNGAKCVVPKPIV